jgi:hypothetical protein
MGTFGLCSWSFPVACKAVTGARQLGPRYQMMGHTTVLASPKSKLPFDLQSRRYLGPSHLGAPTKAK